MTIPFLDTNIILRHLLNDDTGKSPACFRLIQAIERDETLAWTSHLVIAEVVFVLSNKKTYGLTREEIRDRLLPLVNLPGLKIDKKRLFVFDTLVWPTSMIPNGPPSMTKTGTLCVSKIHEGNRCEGEKREWSYSKQSDVNTSSG